MLDPVLLLLNELLAGDARLLHRHRFGRQFGLVVAVGSISGRR